MGTEKEIWVQKKMEFSLIKNYIFLYRILRHFVVP